MASSAFRPPSFNTPPLASSPDATFVAAPVDGVLPEGFFATTNLPTYVRHEGTWKLPREPRMDGALVLDNAGEIWVREGRRVRAGDLVAIGREEDGSCGIYVHTHGFNRPSSANEFSFMGTVVSRERPIDYPQMARLLIEERERKGYIVWVVGPAIVHARARAEFVWFVEHGFVHVLLAGNAVAVHDIEASIYGTSLGVPESGEPAAGGHSLHLRAINKVRAAGSIAAAVESGVVKDGIMYACVRERVPFVLCGSIRDDGPLPEVIYDVLAAQDAMRQHAKKATMAVMIATALHAIATGNMLPAFVESDGALRALPTICVDSSEFVVSKLKDRGTHQAFGVVTNAQDFLHILHSEIEDQLAGGEGGRMIGTPPPNRDRFLCAIAERIAPERVQAVFLFPPMRQGPVETGVAVLAVDPPVPVAELVAPEQESGNTEHTEHAENDTDTANTLDVVLEESLPVAADTASLRPMVLTARYRHTLKGPDRGKWELEILEQADAPLITIETVVRGVQTRLDDQIEPERLGADDLRTALIEGVWTTPAR